MGNIRCTQCDQDLDFAGRHLCSRFSDGVLCAVPIQAGDSNGVQFLCSKCNFPKNDTLTMDMKYCWNCGIKLDWSEWQ